MSIRIVGRLCALAALGLFASLATPLTAQSVHADTWRYVNSWHDATQTDNHGVFFYVNYNLPVEVWMHFSSSHQMTFWYDYTTGLYLNIYSVDDLGWNCDSCQNLPGGLAVYPSDYDEHYKWTGSSWQYAAEAYPSVRGSCYTAPGSTCGSGSVSVGDGYWDTENYLYEQAGSNGYGWWDANTWTVVWYQNYQHVYHY
ncbi:MAG: hypothetical protein ACRDFX_06170 [Chloroflexota bacterium]